MTIPRKYSVSDVKQFVELLKHDPDMPSEKLAGMDELLQVLAHVEFMTDEDIAKEVSTVYRKSK